MSECTKGKLKWERHGNRCNLYMDGAWIGELYVGYGMKSIEEMVANAEELVRRWNAFEEGGLVEELRTALKDVLKRIEDSEEWWMDCPDKGGFDTEKAKTALAKS